MPPRDESPRDPQRAPLHRILREHLGTFLAHTSATDADGEGLPPFVQGELRAYLRCGVLVHGAARFRCDDCGHDRLVALSCKGRGFCPRCGGRRMTELAAHLVERVLPEVRVRQWVLTLPFRLRYRAAFDHDLALAIWRVAVRAIEARHRRSVRAALPSATGIQGGSVTAIHRFGTDLRLNLHFHGLFLDGAYATVDGASRFVPVSAPTRDDLHEVLAKIVTGIDRLLRRRGIDLEGGVTDAPPTAIELVQARALLGSGATKHAPDEHASPVVPERERRKARIDGFDLDATVAVSPKRRERLAELCRYVLRPPFAQQRLRIMFDGTVVLALRHPFADGTTHVSFTPHAFLERLASLVPAPRANTVLYDGVLAAHASRRAAVVASAEHASRPRNASWAELMRRSFGLDVLACPDCGGRLRYLATIVAPDGLHPMLRAKGLPDEALPIRPARAPPGQFEASF